MGNAPKMHIPSTSCGNPSLPDPHGGHGARQPRRHGWQQGERSREGSGSFRVPRSPWWGHTSARHPFQLIQAGCAAAGIALGSAPRLARERGAGSHTGRAAPPCCTLQL